MSSPTPGPNQSEGRLSVHLIREHDFILKVINSLQGRLEDLAYPERLSNRFMREVLEFGGSFIDRYHMRKEEDCIFPLLEAKEHDVVYEYIKVVLEEHELCRALIGDISERLRLYEEGASSISDLVNLCLEYIELLRQHIYKEDKLLLPLLDSLLSDEDIRVITACYEEKERELGTVLRDMVVKWERHPRHLHIRERRKRQGV